MRRKDRERTEQEFMDEVFQKAEVIYLAFHDGEYPYCLPFNFAKSGSSLFIHSAKEGHKLDCLDKNPHVSFALACDIEIDRAEFTTYYKSVCGKGLARTLTSPEDKVKALDIIGRRYQALCPSPAPLATAERVAIIKIDIAVCTGKECKAKSRPKN